MTALFKEGLSVVNVGLRGTGSLSSACQLGQRGLGRFPKDEALLLSAASAIEAHTTLCYEPDGEQLGGDISRGRFGDQHNDFGFGVTGQNVERTPHGFLEHLGQLSGDSGGPCSQDIGHVCQRIGKARGGFEKDQTPRDRLHSGEGCAPCG